VVQEQQNQQFYWWRYLLGFGCMSEYAPVQSSIRADFEKRKAKPSFALALQMLMAFAVLPKSFCIMYVLSLHTAHCLIGKSARSYDFF
jgi:hypothetical protein